MEWTPCAGESDLDRPAAGAAYAAEATNRSEVRQLERPEHAERRQRAGEAITQIRSALGENAVMHAIALEPWSHLPERQWALAPYDISSHRDPRK